MKCMAVGTRQKRLRDLLGANDRLCFQVCIGVTTYISTKHAFDAVIKQRGITFSDDNHVTLPKTSYREDLFSPGWLMDGGDKKRGHVVSTQALYTTSPYSLIGLDPDKSKASDDLKKIIALYIPAIEETFPDLSFGENTYADCKSFGVDFKYIVQPYQPELCHPADLDQLMPITLLGEHAIHPCPGVSGNRTATKFRL